MFVVAAIACVEILEQKRFLFCVLGIYSSGLLKSPEKCILKI